MSRDERGSTIPLIIGCALVVATLVGVVVDASAAFLRRGQLDALADGAALAATEGVEGEAAYTQGLGPRLEIDPGQASRDVRRYLASAGATTRYPGLRVVVRTDADRVVVHLVAPLHLPLGVPGVDSTASVAGDAASVVRVGP